MLVRYKPHLVKLAERRGLVDSAGVADLKLLENDMVGTYNGYCFNTVSPGEGHSVLNPWDVLSVLYKVGAWQASRYRSVGPH